MKWRHWSWKGTKPLRLSLQRRSLSGRHGRLKKKSNLSLRASSICGFNFRVFAAVIQGFQFLQRSEIDATDDVKDGPGLQDTAALCSEADGVIAIEALLKTDLSARYLMGSTFPDEHSLFWISHWQRS